MEGRKLEDGLVLMETSNGHRIYWPDKCSISIERSVKFANGDMILPPIPSAEPIQGESDSNKANGLLHRNSMDTDSDSDDNLSTAVESWTVEFDRYIKTVEAVGKDVDIVDWWGVSGFFLLLILPFTQYFHSSMLADIQHGHHSLATTLRLWHHPYQVSGPFQLRESQLASAATG
jgi:hypothetical protein